MSDDALNKSQFDQLLSRIDAVEMRLADKIDDVEGRMITKADVFQSVLTVQAFFAATIVGTVVVLSVVGSLG